VAQISFLVIGSTYVLVALTSVGQTSVALTSVAKMSVGEKSRHPLNWMVFKCIASTQTAYNISWIVFDSYL
jgi:hypothetical protein